MQNVLSRQSLEKLSIKQSINTSRILSTLNLLLKWKKDLDNVEEGKIKWVEVIDEFLSETLKNMSKLQMLKWRKLKLKMNLLAKIVKNADRRWSSNWADTANSWLVPISLIAEIRKQLSNRLALLVHLVKKDKLSNGKVKRNDFLGCDQISGM